MERNSDINLYVAPDARHSSVTTQLASDLRELGYSVSEDQKNAEYLVLNDFPKDFDINNYRNFLHIALRNDQPILMISKGLPFFMQYEDGVYFTRLYARCQRKNSFDDEKILIDYNVDNPPGFYSDIKPTVFINRNDDRKIYAMRYDGQQPPQHDKDQCCWKVWKGLYY